MTIDMTKIGQIIEQELLAQGWTAPLPPAIPQTPSPISLSTPKADYSIVTKNMTFSTDQTYKSNDLPKDRACYVQARLNAPAKDGQTVKFSYERTTNVDPDGTKNIKDERNWNTASVNYPNDYTGRSLHTGSHQFAIENGDGIVISQKTHPTDWTVAYFSMPFVKDQKQLVEYEYKYASAKGKSDGSVKITVDGKVVLDVTGARLGAPRSDFGAQMIYAPNSGDSGTFPAGSYYEAKILSLKVS